MQENEKVINSLEQNFNRAKILSDVVKGNKKRISFKKYVLTSCLNEVLVLLMVGLKLPLGIDIFLLI